MLIVFGGLPGVGKTTLSRTIAQRLGATYLRVDAAEAAMWAAGIDRAQPTGIAAYGVINALAGANLRLGATVVADAVNPVEAARAGWRDLAAAEDVPLRVIEVVCSDLTEHRRRVTERIPDLVLGGNPTWAEVEAREYEPWTESRLTVDTVKDGDDLVRLIMEYVSRNPAVE
jgi:predicted kinase